MSEPQEQAKACTTKQLADFGELGRAASSQWQRKVLFGKEIGMARRFADLSEQEILALAISNEEEDSRIYADIDYALRADYPATAKVFEGMEAEEQEHRRVLTELYRSAIWRAYSADSEGGCEGIYPASAGVAGAAAGDRGGEEIGRDDGAGGAAVLRAGGAADDGCGDAEIIG
jgi:hypothetical protein